MAVKTMDWFGCYSSGWRNEIVPEAFSHPAKFARGLIRRIYEHALERGYLRESDTVLDPFGGIALGAADALANGLNFVGVELEQSFVDMGAGCDCTGIGKADWVACFGRWKRFAYKDGRHWCPRCLTEAEKITGERKAPEPDQAQAKRRARMRELIAKTGRKVDFNLYAPMPFPESHNQPAETLRLFGADPLIASYKRSSGKIPHTEPHYYSGNLDLFAKHARNGATAVLMQGDSRRLVEVLEGARAEGIIASPPWSSTTDSGKREWIAEQMRTGKMRTTASGDNIGSDSPSGTLDGYGTDPAQLGNMPTGEPPQAVIGSPPHGVSGVGHDAGHPRLDAVEDTRREAKGCKRRPAYGKSNGQLAAMREGDVDAVIGSPPHATSEVVQSHGRSWRVELDETEGSWRNMGSRYGDQDGQLAQMREGDPLAAIVSSPPFADSQQSTDADFVLDSTKVNPTPRKLADRSYFPAEMESDGQLAALPEGVPAAGIVSSPPYECTRTIPGEDESEIARGYGNSTGKERTQAAQGTFWSAAKTILLQCHQVLAPDGYAIFVTKRFVRDKAIVDFSQQWADLCQSCGFELVEWIKAWLVEERGTQYDLEGEAHTKIVKRFSFFRRLHAQKYPDLAIEWEDVLIFRKGDLT